MLFATISGMVARVGYCWIILAAGVWIQMRKTLNLWKEGKKCFKCVTDCSEAKKFGCSQCAVE